MKIGFYSRIACSNICKNSSLYLPNILAGIGLEAVFYIFMTLALDNRLGSVRGGTYLADVMPLGVVVLGILSVILLLYTNSFLMKQRNREFGLYNVLGMEKRHIGRILFWEMAICALFVLAGGVALGFILYKLCALIICRLLDVESVLGFYYFSWETVAPSILFFTAIYVVAFLLNRLRIARMKPTELLQSTQVGEREPKVKWLLLFIGILSLGGGYYISVTTEQPLRAIEMFFVAVLLVILGTYCLFITGITALLKMMKHSSHFYYKKKHFVAVSGLLYRMKLNGVGLASIAVLATMVLVMLSTTVSMYAGIGDTIKRQYYHQMAIMAQYTNQGEEWRTIPLESMKEMAEQTADEFDLTVSYTEHQQYLGCAICREGEAFLEERTNDLLVADKVAEAWFMTEEEYKRLTGHAILLNENEMAYYALPGNESAMSETLTFGDTTYQCRSVLTEYPVSMEGYAIVDCFGFVVKDEAVLKDIYELQKSAYGKNASEMSEYLVLDFADEERMEAVYEDYMSSLREKVREYVNDIAGADQSCGMSVDSKWDMIEYLYGMYGTMLFLGLLLSLIFIFATALIIYYKQISEGYEDRERFFIMQKVGMSQDEVKSTIKSQILLVFFLPLLVAAMHIAFAFPILTRLLRALFYADKMLFLECTLGALLAFVVLYVVIYSMTARTYYKLVRWE
jgi:putative ABC transport system permease protein